MFIQGVTFGFGAMVGMMGFVILAVCLVAALAWASNRGTKR